MFNNQMHIWNPHFYKNSLLFDLIVQPLQKEISHCNEWPTVNFYNQWLSLVSEYPVSAANKPIRFVTQTDKPNTFEAQYEPRIYLKGEVQTRAQHWHDFFNALAWINFPKLKAALNAMQYKYIKDRWGISSLRTSVENALTLFDEGGVIFICSDDDLIELLQNFNWQELLYNRRSDFLSYAKVIIFGHALYEKALNPYVGITGNAVILRVAQSFLACNMQEQLIKLDDFLAKQFIDEIWINSAHPFQPLPILGVPGWHEANNHVSFYENHNYFRDKGKRKNMPILNLSR